MGIFRDLIDAIKAHTKALDANTKVIAQNNEIWSEGGKTKFDPPSEEDPPKKP